MSRSEAEDQGYQIIQKFLDLNGAHFTINEISNRYRIKNLEFIRDSDSLPEYIVEAWIKDAKGNVYVIEIKFIDYNDTLIFTNIH